MNKEKQEKLNKLFKEYKEQEKASFENYRFFQDNVNSYQILLEKRQSLAFKTCFEFIKIMEEE
jgi:hypothetical protein